MAATRKQAGRAQQPELFELHRGMRRQEFLDFLNEPPHKPPRVLRPGLHVDVKVTRNRVSMITIQFEPSGPVRVRAHEAFLAAPERVLLALRRYIRTRRKAEWRTVAAFARSIPSNRPGVSVSAGQTAGRVYDLRRLLGEVADEFFGGRLSCRIRWGRRRSSGRRGGRSRSIRFGSWDAATRAIRVHPILDNERVPRQFVKYIVFHEALHTVVPAEIRNSRRYDHTAAFRSLERRFPGYKTMKSLSRELLDVLL